MHIIETYPARAYVCMCIEVCIKQKKNTWKTRPSPKEVDNFSALQIAKQKLAPTNNKLESDTSKDVNGCEGDKSERVYGWREWEVGWEVEEKFRRKLVQLSELIRRSPILIQISFCDHFYLFFYCILVYRLTCKRQKDICNVLKIVKIIFV